MSITLQLRFEDTVVEDEEVAKTTEQTPATRSHEATED
jgi:hypothetical protein